MGTIDQFFAAADHLTRPAMASRRYADVRVDTRPLTYLDFFEEPHALRPSLEKLGFRLDDESMQAWQTWENDRLAETLD